MIKFYNKIDGNCKVNLTIGNQKQSYSFKVSNTDQIKINEIKLQAGRAELIPTIEVEGKIVQPFYLQLKSKEI